MGPRHLSDRSRGPERTGATAPKLADTAQRDAARCGNGDAALHPRRQRAVTTDGGEEIALEKTKWLAIKRASYAWRLRPSFVRCADRVAALAYTCGMNYAPT